MAFEQSEKPGLKRKLAHDPARQAQLQTPLVPAIYLLSHSLQGPELLCLATVMQRMQPVKCMLPRRRMLSAHP